MLCFREHPRRALDLLTRRHRLHKRVLCFHGVLHPVRFPQQRRLRLRLDGRLYMPQQRLYAGLEGRGGEAQTQKVFQNAPRQSREAEMLYSLSYYNWYAYPKNQLAAWGLLLFLCKATLQVQVLIATWGVSYVAGSVELPEVRSRVHIYRRPERIEKARQSTKEIMYYPDKTYGWSRFLLHY